MLQEKDEDQAKAESLARTVGRVIAVTVAFLARSLVAPARATVVVRTVARVILVLALIALFVWAIVSGHASDIQ